MPFDTRGASRERVIGLSFVDILIQFLFVLFIAYLVILEEKNGKTSPIAYGHISTSPKKSDEERLFEISKDLKKIIENRD